METLLAAGAATGAIPLIRVLVDAVRDRQFSRLVPVVLALVLGGAFAYGAMVTGAVALTPGEVYLAAFAIGGNASNVHDYTARSR